MRLPIGRTHTLGARWATGLALCLLLSSVLGLAGLASTGHLLWTTHAPQPTSAHALSTASEQSRVSQQAALIGAKQAQLEANELRASRSAAQSVAHEKLLQFDVRKEERLLELSAPAVAASDLQVFDGLDRADAIAALRATTRMDMTPEAPDDANIEPWTLQDDLTPVRVWQ